MEHLRYGIEKPLPPRARDYPAEPTVVWLKTGHRSLRAVFRLRVANSPRQNGSHPAPLGPYGVIPGNRVPGGSPRHAQGASRATRLQLDPKLSAELQELRSYFLKCSHLEGGHVARHLLPGVGIDVREEVLFRSWGVRILLEIPRPRRRDSGLDTTQKSPVLGRITLPASRQCELKNLFVKEFEKRLFGILLH